MKKIIAISVIAAGLVAGCAQDQATTTQPLEAALNKKGGGGGVTSECGGRTELLDSRIDLVWDDNDAGVTSDGKDEYRGGQGGVHGKIFYHDSGCSRSFDAVFDPDFNQSSNPRKLVFRFPPNNLGLSISGIATGPFMNFAGLMRLGSDIGEAGVSDSRDAKVEEKNPGAPRALEYPAAEAFRPGYPEYGSFGENQFRFNTEIKGCEQLVYDEVQLERTVGTNGYQPTGGSIGDTPLGQWSDQVLGEWVVESVAPHKAQCFRTVKNKLEPHGAKLQMPFRVTITERRP